MSLTGKANATVSDGLTATDSGPTRSGWQFATEARLSLLGRQATTCAAAWLECAVFRFIASARVSGHSRGKQNVVGTGNQDLFVQIAAPIQIATAQAVGTGQQRVVPLGAAGNAPQRRA